MNIKSIFHIALLAISTFAIAQQNFVENPPTTIESVQYEALQQKIQQSDDVLYVVNFWATWCVPCVEEMPSFLEVNEKFKNDPHFKMYLVSLDSPKSKDKILAKFIEKRNIQAEVILLDDHKRMNTWIPSFDENWSGSIPATILYKNNEKLFFIEGSLQAEELTTLIQTYLP